MITTEKYEKLPVHEYDLKPVPRGEVQAYLDKFLAVADPITKTGEVDRMNWDAWRDLRAPDYFIQWNIHQGRFRFTVDEYIERWRWSARTGRIWEPLDYHIHIIETGFITEGILRSRHVDENGQHVTLPICETFHIQDGLAVFSNEYVDPTFMGILDKDIPGGW
jgi:hypothetical protein